jgi:hypothetical protein
MLLCIIENMNPNYTIIPCFVKKIQKTFKICAISKQNMWFFIVSTYSSSYSFLNSMSHLFPLPCSPELSPFELSQATSSRKKQQKFKIQTNKVP